MLPGSAPNLSNPLTGVPLGYGDSRSGLNSPYPNGVLGVLKQKRAWKVYPSFPSRRPSADRRTLPRQPRKASFFRFFSIFFASKKTSKKTIVKKPLFSHFFAISARPGVDFSSFSVPKRVPGGYFFGVFSKTAISSKSRSRLGNNRIFEGRTV